jgi:hypothetical protein
VTSPTTLLTIGDLVRLRAGTGAYGSWSPRDNPIGLVLEVEPDFYTGVKLWAGTVRDRLLVLWVSSGTGELITSYEPAVALERLTEE